MALANTVAGGANKPTVVTPAYTAAYNAAIKRGNTPANAVIIAKKATMAPAKPALTATPTGGLKQNLVGGAPAPGAVKTPTTPAKPATPAAPTVDQYLAGDTVYQQQLAAIHRALADQQTSQSSAQNDYLATYGQNQHDIQTEQTRAIPQQQDDYAGRGLFHSGLYAKAAGDMISDYSDRNAKLDLAKQQYLTGLQQQGQNFASQQDLAQQKAMQDAISRRAISLQK